MKILQIIQKSQLRGAETFASQLSNHLIDEGHIVHVISLFPGDGLLPFKGNIVKLDRPLKNRVIDILGWRQLARYINEFKPDIVQANAGDTLKFSVLSKLIFSWKAPIVFRNASKVSDFIDSKAKLFFNKWLVSKVAHVISVSELCRQDFIKVYNFDEYKTTTITIGVEEEKVDIAIPQDLQKYFAHTNVLLNVASFVPEKNHNGILSIASAMLIKGFNFKILLLGDGKLKPFIMNRIQTLGLQDHVFILGYRNDVHSIMANASALILPSLIEGLPGVILEAFYCKTPVVAYDVGGISEALRNDDTGFLIEKGDERGFVDAIEQIFSNEAKATSMTINAYDLVCSQFNNKNIAKKFAEVYKSIL